MKKIMFLALTLLIGVGAFANELNVYPIEGIFSSKNLQSKVFKKALKEEKDFFINKFNETFDKYFPNANKEFSDKTKYKTFVSYVNIPRASEYEVVKGGRLLDVYLPLTMSINFSNMATGQMLYSLPITRYYKYETVVQEQAQQKENEIKNLIKDNYSKTLDELVLEASGNFQPFSITTQIIDNYKDFYVLDKGLKAGIAQNDILSDEQNNKIKVVYSNLNYSIAQKNLGKPQAKVDYTKFANKTSDNSINKIKKPKVLFLNDFNNEMLYNIFSDSLGSASSFSLINVDKTFFDMQNALISLNDGFKTSNAYNRELPEYFLKLYFTPAAYAQYKSNKEFLNADKYGMIACAQIFDTTGRILYSACSDDETTEKVVGDIRFNDEANQEIIAKNALNKLSETIKKEVQFKNTRFKIIKSQNGYLDILDPDGFLKKGNTITVYRKIKANKKGKVLIPMWKYRVIARDGSILNCKMAEPYTNYPSKKDIAQMMMITKGANKASMFNFSDEAFELEDNEMVLKNFKQVSRMAFASTFKKPLVIKKEEYLDQLKELNGLGFKADINIADNKENLAVRIVYQIKKIKEDKKGTALKQEYEIIVGAVLKKNGESIAQDGLSQTVSIIVPKENNEKIIEYELLKAIYPLISQIAAKL